MALQCNLWKSVTGLGVRGVENGIMKYVLGPLAESISYVEDACDTSASS
jgi:hypothetical protein